MIERIEMFNKSYRLRKKHDWKDQQLKKQIPSKQLLKNHH